MAEIRRAFIVLLFAMLFTAFLISTPSSLYAADECDATLSQGGLIHIPVVRYMEDLYTLDLQYLGPSGSGIAVNVVNIATTAQECPVESEVTSLSPFTLKIASLVIGSDNYDITLSSSSGLKTNAPRLPVFLNPPYVANGFNAGTGMRTIFKIDLDTLVGVNKNKDVWKGKSECTRDLKAVYPGGTSYATAKGRNVTFTQDTTVAADNGYVTYKVFGGNLSYRAYQDYAGMQILETASTSAMPSSAGTIKMGLFDEATGTGTLNFERTGSVTTSAGYCNYSGIAYAEWLYIPSIIFSSSKTKPMTEVMRTGKIIELNKMPGGCVNGPCASNMRTWHCTVAGTNIDIPTPDFAWLQGDLTCTWSFKYYP